MSVPLFGLDKHQWRSRRSVTGIVPGGDVRNVGRLDARDALPTRVRRCCNGLWDLRDRRLASSFSTPPNSSLSSRGYSGLKHYYSHRCYHRYWRCTGPKAPGRVTDDGQSRVVSLFSGRPLPISRSSYACNLYRIICWFIAARPRVQILPSCGLFPVHANLDICDKYRRHRGEILPITTHDLSTLTVTYYSDASTHALSHFSLPKKKKTLSYKKKRTPLWMKRVYFLLLN